MADNKVVGVAKDEQVIVVGTGSKGSWKSASQPAPADDVVVSADELGAIKRKAAYAGPQDHLLDTITVQSKGKPAAAVNTSICGIFNAGRGDKLITAMHDGPEMCPVCRVTPSTPGGTPNRPQWPGV